MAVQSLRARVKETTSLAILDAAEELAAEAGLPGASLQLIAQRAGVAVGTIYNYFADRGELFTALFARRRGELLAALDGSAKQSGGLPFSQQLDALVRTVLSYFDGHRSFLRIAMDGSGVKPQHLAPDTQHRHDRRPGAAQTSIQQLTARAERIVRVGLKENQLRRECSDLLAPFLIAALRAVLMARVDDPKPLAAETERVVELFLRGARR